VQYFILLTSDSNKYANEILEQRLKSKVWEIYDKTNLRNQLQEKSKVIFYLAGAGPNSQHFVGEAMIDKIIYANSSYSEEANTMIHSTLHFDKITKYKIPVSIKKIMKNLKFIKNPAKYGTALNGGVRRISESDYLVIRKS
jgi:predicted RNA-binding protein